MKIIILAKKLILVFSLIGNTVFLYSQEIIVKKEVLQNEAKCLSLIVTPTNQNVTSSAGTASFTVTANVSWTSSSNQPWCTVTPSGDGNGTITASYQLNTGTGSRIATITASGSGVSNQVVTITQLGTAPSLIVTPLNQNVTSSSGTTSFSVTSNVSWSSSSDQTWCVVNSSGSGNGTVTAAYQANTGTGPRVASITISGSGVSDQVVKVTQSGTALSLIVTPSNQNVTSPSGSIGFDVASNVEWTTTVNQPWCTVTPSGINNGTIIATYQANPGTSPRTATITVYGAGVSNQMVTVTQSAARPTLIVTPLNYDVTSSSGTVSYNVVSNIAWTSTSDQAWCNVSTSGTGNGTITAEYQANNGATPRIATITITGSDANNQVVTLTQDELITISYSGSPWCPSEGIQNVTLNGTSGGTYSSQPAGLNIDPATGSITPGLSTSGSYTVTYTLEKAGGSRVLEASTVVDIYSTVTPQIAIKWEDVLICINVGNLYFSYQWFNGNTPISGATKQYYVTSKIQGEYSVEATDINGCKVMSNEIKLGIAKAPVVYPNPAKSSFIISFDDVPVGKAHVSIVNTSGSEVMNFNTEKSDFEFFEEISTSKLEKGLYFVQITVNDTYIYSVKIMVNK